MADTPKTVIFNAPAGWGKTAKKDELRQLYGCTSVVDEWNPTQPITKGALHLTNVEPWDLLNLPNDVDVVQGWFNTSTGERP